MRTERILNYVLLIGLIFILMFALVNGQGEEVTAVTDLPEEVEAQEEADLTPLITNLDVLFIDKINGSAIKLTNCAVVLMGKIKMAEDSFDYKNTFIEGDRYEITIMIESKK